MSKKEIEEKVVEETNDSTNVEIATNLNIS